MEGAGGDQATTEDVEAALEALSTADMVRLDRAAKHFCLGITVIEPDELLNKAIQHVLEGWRGWPRTVRFTTFLSNVMKSLASQYREQHRNRRCIPESELAPDDDPTETMHRGVSQAPNPEEAALRRERDATAVRIVTDIESMFENDEEILTILEGKKAEWTAEQIRMEFGMSVKQYATALRRLRRTLDRKYPKGWNS